jgi:phosphohistidine phosphatase SixA
VVGHNPSVEQLAHELEATDQTNRGMRTSGVAVFEVSGWHLEQASLTHWR